MVCMQLHPRARNAPVLRTKLNFWSLFPKDTGGRGTLCFAVGNFALRVECTTHFTDDDVGPTACAVAFAEEVWGVDAKFTTAILRKFVPPPPFLHRPRPRRIPISAISPCRNGASWPLSLCRAVALSEPHAAVRPCGAQCHGTGDAAILQHICERLAAEAPLHLCQPLRLRWGVHAGALPSIQPQQLLSGPEWDLGMPLDTLEARDGALEPEPQGNPEQHAPMYRGGGEISPGENFAV